MKVNFEVKACKDGVPSLAYNAQGFDRTLCDMWKLENRVSEKTDNRRQKFQFNEGDFILYDLSRSMSDDYKSGGTF